MRGMWPVMMWHALLIALGGGVGSVLRHGVAVGVEQLLGPREPGRFPVATLAVNVVGCVVIGLLAERLAGREPARLVLVVGLLGGFTTFSSFGLDAVRLVSSGHPGKALAYVLATNAAGLAAVWIAYRAMGEGPASGLEPE